MAHRERSEPMTDEELEDLAQAAEELGRQLTEALAEETARDPDAFTVNPPE